MDIEGSLSGGYVRPAANRQSRRSFGLLSDGSMRHKAFRLGTTEPPSVTLLKELLGPLVVVTSLALCLDFYRLPLSLESLALAVIVFLLSNRILSAPRMQIDLSGRPRAWPRPPRLLLEWTTVAALLAFVATALKFTQLFPRGALLTWFILTPAALLASNCAAIRLTRWWTARCELHRHIIIGATDIGLELAKRVEQDCGAGGFLGFFDFRDRERLPSARPGALGRRLPRTSRSSCSVTQSRRSTSRCRSPPRRAWRSCSGIARHHGVDLFRAESVCVRSGAGPLRRDQRHAGARRSATRRSTA